MGAAKSRGLGIDTVSAGGILMMWMLAFEGRCVCTTGAEPFKH